jgi:hypothetical protein
MRAGAVRLNHTAFTATGWYGWVLDYLKDVGMAGIRQGLICGDLTHVLSPDMSLNRLRSKAIDY